MKALITNAEVFVCWVIYDHPKDYPNHFVLRRWEWETPDEDCQLFDTLEQARAALPRVGLICMRGDPDKAIIETWI
jgi:hypothetical protein